MPNVVVFNTDKNEWLFCDSVNQRMNPKAPIVWTKDKSKAKVFDCFGDAWSRFCSLHRNMKLRIEDAYVPVKTQEPEPHLYMKVSQSTLSDEKMIEHLKSECRRVKIQRNEFEQRLTQANKRIVVLASELKMLKDYINRNDK